jgi:hypothetical protein
VADRLAGLTAFAYGPAAIGARSVPRGAAAVLAIVAGSGLGMCKAWNTMLTFVSFSLAIDH